MPVLRIPCSTRQLGSVERAFVEGLGLERAGEERIEGQLLESFDGRMARDGGLLERRRDGDRHRLVWTGLDLVCERGSLADAPPAPILARALPAGPVRERLATLLEERALLDAGRLRRLRRAWVRRDANSKIVLRLFVEHAIELWPHAGARQLRLQPQIHIEGLLGYEAALADARTLVGKMEQLSIEPEPWGASLLRACGHEPGADPSELRFAVQAELAATEGYRRVFTALLAVIEANRAGAGAALDPEFLHDLRVAIRRTRVLIAASSEVVPKSVREYFAAEFKWLGGETSRLRDLDVYLLNFDDFVERTRRVSKEDLEPLRALLRTHQADERRKVSSALGSVRARALLDDWRSSLEESAWSAFDSDEAPQALLSVAARRIRSAERRVLTLGRSIEASSPDADLHELRKRAKKLRYLLEFFGPVVDDKATKERIGQLKELQNLLGEHQDRAVQIIELQNFARELTTAPPRALMAMGFLVEGLDAERKELRGHFAERFAAYDRRDTRRRFGELLERAESATPAKTIEGAASVGAPQEDSRT